jgi:probable HAF family extracellular repeat protein
MNNNNASPAWAVLLAAALASPVSRAAPQYFTTDLGTVGGTYSHGFGVNDAGQVAGFAHTAGNSAIRAASVLSGRFQDLGSLGGSSSFSYDINAAGVQTGSAYLTADLLQHAFRTGVGGFEDLKTLGGSHSRGLGINDLGDVTGASSLAGDAAEHAFLFRSGTLSDLGTLGGPASQGNDINNAGQVTGFADLADRSFHAVLWQNGQVTDLGGVSGGTYSEGLGINDAGAVAGYLTNAAGQQHAALWLPGQPGRDLGTLGGSFSTGYDINRDGHVVGAASNAAEALRAVIWKGAAAVDLNTLILPQPQTAGSWFLTGAHGISDNGRITGIGTVTTLDTASLSLRVEQHAFLLIPDTTPPRLTCPPPVNMPVAGQQPLGLGTPQVSDDLSTVTDITVSNDRPATFPAGDTTVTWTAVDGANNRSTCTQRVSLPVSDSTPPDILSLLNPANPDGLNGWYISPSVSLTWSVTDLQSPSTIIKTGCVDSTVSTDTAGQSFSCAAISAGGTAAAVTTTIKRDATAPVVSVPAALNEAATSAAGSVVSYPVATATDATSGVGSVSCSPVSGATFPLGSTPVNCVARDNAGNADTKSFTVTVSDTIGPVVTVPANITAAATSNLGAVVTYTGFSATDAGTGVSSAGVSCAPASGATFALGTNTVTCSATDNAGNRGSASFTVTVNDTVAPVVTVPASITAEATGPGGAIVSYAAATAADPISGLNASGVSCEPASGSTFAIRTTPVSCSATDNAGNIGTASFNVIVRDTIAPAVTVPANITAAATARTGATVTYTGFGASDTGSGVSAAGVSCAPASGSTFAVGTTSVTCSARDNAGNLGSRAFSVTVNDTTPPVLSTQTNIIASATSAAGAAVTYPPVTATDSITAVTAAGVSCAPTSGSTFPLGTTPVNCSATDSAGNIGSTRFTVSVIDTTPPVVTAPASITVAATSPSGAVVTYANATAVDPISGVNAAGVSCLPVSGSTFALGTTTVTCTARDNANNAGSASFTVTVSDTTPPLITPPADITVTATSAAGAVVSYANATATDAVTAVSAAGVSCAPVSGSTFALGTTLVNCSARDTAGNLGTASFRVTVADTVAPTVSVSNNLNIAATSPAGAVATYAAPTATDGQSGVTAAGASCTPASGTTFALGTTTVNCSALDNAGNTGTASFTVTVSDTGAPVLTAVADIGAAATGPNGAVVTYTNPTATDAITRINAAGVTCSPASGSTFGLGTTTVNCSATDTAGNTGSSSFKVTVSDTVKPVVTVSPDVSVPATGRTGAVVTYAAANATDNASGVTADGVTCSPISGSTFAIGTTTVTCSALDNAGNGGSASFLVTVTDAVAPVVTVPADVSVAATSPAGAVVSYAAATATDNASGVTAAGVSCAPVSGTTFALGTTTVNCSAQDASGNSGSASFQVTVSDRTPPVLTPPADVTVTATSAQGALVSYPLATASDAISAIGAAGVSCAPASGSTFPVGTTTVSCSAADTAGNTGQTSFLVVVNPVVPPADKTAPEIGAIVTPAVPDGANGWYRSVPVSVAWNVVDGESAVTSSTGCDSVSFAADTAPQTLTCTATSAGGSQSASQAIRIDVTPPVVTAPANVSATATGSTGALVSYAAATASDATSGVSAAGAVCLPASGSQFPVGVTSVRCSAQDNAGNTGSASFTVTVSDQAAPVVNVPADITVAAVSAAGNTVVFNASANDTVSGPLPVSCRPASGSTFAIGSTQVSCSATDGEGNIGTASFQVTVADQQAPQVTVPADIGAEAANGSGAAISFAASAQDAIDGAVAVSCTPASGSTFALGSTAVQCSARDAAGNARSAGFNVIVRDSVAPQLTLPGNLTASAVGPNGALVSFAASAVDTVSGPVSASCAPASGSVFALGATAVNCSASDAAGNTARGSFNVTVVDNAAPQVIVPADLIVEATSSAGAVTTFVASANDAITGSVPAVCTPASGSALTLGTTSVTCSARDGAGNIGTGGFNITVRDTTAPTLALPGRLALTTANAAGTAVDYVASASDAVSGSLPVACSPASGAIFPVGTTTVLCSAVDGAGNRASQSFEVAITQSTNGGQTPVPAGGTVSSAEPGTILDAVTPVIVEVTTPNSGSITITPTVLGTVGNGYGVLGQGFDIVAPPASAAQPLVLHFMIDVASQLPVDVAPSQVTVFRDGLAIAPCDAGVAGASPDPCVAGQGLTNAGGVLDIVVRTSHASTWTLGIKDVTPPAIDALLVPAAPDGANGWYRSPVELTWDVNEPESPTTLATTGCQPLTLNADSAPVSASCAAESLGGISTPVSVTVKRDATAPSITVPTAPIVLTAVPGASSASVTYPVAVSASDALSGVDPASLVCRNGQTPVGLAGDVFPVGFSHVACSATDLAGNQASAGFDVQIGAVSDLTAPDISPQVDGTPGLNGWYVSPVTVAWTVNDPDSPISERSADCALTNVAGNTVGRTLTCSATSLGGTASQSVTVRVDTTPPNLVCPAALRVQASRAIALGSARATDNLTAGPRITNDAPASFPAETVTTVTWKAEDDAGWTATCEQLVEVIASTGGIDGTPSAQDDVILFVPGKQRSVSAPGVLANDIDFSDSELSADLTQSVAGQLGRLRFSSNGGFRFLPAGAAVRSASFAYRAKNEDRSSTQSATVQLQADQAPLPQADECAYDSQLRQVTGNACKLLADGRIRVNLVDNDVDPDSTLPLTADKRGGKVVGSSVAIVSDSVTGGPVERDSDGTLVFRPMEGRSLRYTVADDLGVRSGQQSFSLIVR